MGNLSDEDKAGKTEYLFFVHRPVAVIVFAENKKAARAIHKQVMAHEMEEGYVHWFDDVPGVDRTHLSTDPVEAYKNGRIEEY